MANITVHRHMGKFLELPRDHVNAFIVELADSIVIVDATLAISSASGLRQKAEAIGKPIEAVLLTHGHPDHYTGLASFQDVPRLASQGAVDFAHREDVVKAPVATMLFGEDYPKERVFPDQIVRDGQSFTFGGAKFTFHDLGPAESDSDGMWVVRDGSTDYAFVGDAVAKASHCFFRDGHTKEWLGVLDRLEREFGDDVQMYFGHGATPGGHEVIDWQRGYVRAFLREVEKLRNHPAPTSHQAQEQLVAGMKDYLPTDTTLFLLQYELEVSVGRLLGLQEAATL
jgi:glyoxylase-like metal-dependent hydrolase (beta-lactamase superfamily II)